jgi:hypothetical protein
VEFLILNQEDVTNEEGLQGLEHYVCSNVLILETQEENVLIKMLPLQIT